MNAGERAAHVAQKIAELTKERPLRLMEVCGTHTVSVFREGIRQLLPKSVELVSGPGCPVCVTEDETIDLAIEYAKRDDITLATFGDMLKVPGSVSSLAKVKADGADVKIVYSPLDCLTLAAENPARKILFFAVGFETTAPTEAALVLAAKEAGIKNIFLLPAQKLMIPALRFLLKDENNRPDGLVLPGHVAAVTGADYFSFVADDYNVPGVVAGFEGEQILRAVYELAELCVRDKAQIKNAYEEVVTCEGNKAAMNILFEVFEPCSASWRGIGELENSGLMLTEKYSAFDIGKVLPISVPSYAKKTACRCGDVLTGRIKPPQCPLFGAACTPMNAKGACMVSVEGTCAAWYKYGGGSFCHE